MKVIGHLEKICRYPVKSMAGEEIPAIYVHETGLNGDRVYAFYDPDSKRAGLPFFTGKDQRGLLLLQPRFADSVDPTRPHTGTNRPLHPRQVLVTMPDGGSYRISDPKLVDHIQNNSNRKLSLTLDYRSAGIFHSKPVSLIGMKTLEQLAKEMGVDVVDHRRYRENFYVNWESDKPFFEDSLVGSTIQIGDSVVLHVVKRTERCAQIAEDPETGKYDKKFLTTVGINHENKAGIYAIVRKPGLVNHGDPVYLRN